MHPQDVLPTVVIVGRPNVGKSTLFNCIIGRRKAIVGDEPGITRDRIHGEAVHAGRRFELIDTGGIIPDDKDMIPAEILKQARVALDKAAAIIFLIDGRTEITAPDRDLAQMLRQLGKPVVLAVNKIDAAVREPLAADFYSLGFGELFAISAEHRLGVDDMLDHITQSFPPEGQASPEAAIPCIRVAIIGRPNVGKSTLLNALVGTERSIVTDIAGTTRDAVDESVTRDGVQYLFVDTAGIRRKGKTKLMAEKLSVVMARRHIRMCDVVLVVLDATEGVVGLDATIAGYAHEQGRPVVLCLNKWDAAPNKDKRLALNSLRDALKFLDYAPVAFLSARQATGTSQLFGLIRRGWEAANQRVSTGELNRFFERISADRNLGVRYLTQAGIRPPTFVAFMEGSQPLHFSLERWLANQVREHFGFKGSPLIVKSKPKTPRKKR